jgi:hypothetical protein
VARGLEGRKCVTVRTGPTGSKHIVHCAISNQASEKVGLHRVCVLQSPALFRAGLAGGEIMRGTINARKRIWIVQMSAIEKFLLLDHLGSIKGDVEWRRFRKG